MTNPMFDVLVAGAGAAGLAAALSAADRGLEVAIVEASETFRIDSNTAMSTSMVPAGGSRWQAEAGIDDSPERFYSDVMRKTKGLADPVVSGALTGVAPELVAWMADTVGVPLELVTDFRYPGHSTDRCHAVPDRSGLALHSHLLDDVARRTNVTMITPMRLTAAARSDADRISVSVERPDGTNEEATARSVVLATNGYGARRDFLAEFIPEIENAMYHGGPGSTGDALVIGETMQADIAYLDAYQGHGSVATPHGIILTWATVMHGGILINSDGNRFGDETQGYSEYAVPVLSQVGSVAWMIFDERIGNACEVFKDYQDLVDAGAVRWASDISGLASLVGVPAEAVEATLSAAHASAIGSSPDGFGRTEWEQPLSPPYGAVKVTGALFHTQGGLRVDEHARILSAGAPIPGMYAVGGAAMGISGHGASGYLAGNGLLSALGLGYIAGNHVEGNHVEGTHVAASR
jgi:fumarate reductase flavoprotein subunit